MSPPSYLCSVQFTWLLILCKLLVLVQQIPFGEPFDDCCEYWSAHPSPRRGDRARGAWRPEALRLVAGSRDSRIGRPSDEHAFPPRSPLGRRRDRHGDWWRPVARPRLPQSPWVGRRWCSDAHGDRRLPLGQGILRPARWHRIALPLPRGGGHHRDDRAGLVLT